MCIRDRVVELFGAEFWHCAASLQYQDRHRVQIEKTNVTGTANALHLAKQACSPVFNMMSTAYVAGSRQGNIRAEAPDIAYANNCYERSKIMAEQQVLDSGITARIMRPSVVIGHSKTYHSISADGLYGFIRNLTKFRNALERTQVGLSQTLNVSIAVGGLQYRRVGGHFEVHATGCIDLVPIDAVVEDAVGLSNAGAAPGYCLLYTSPSPRDATLSRMPSSA